MTPTETDRYCPWADLGERFPAVLLHLANIHPARARWVCKADVILLHKRLTRAEGRCALAHEIAHIDLGHRPTAITRYHDVQEREADKLAARRLIRIADLAEAYAWTHDDERLAEILNVDVSTVHARLGTLHPSERHYIEARIARIEHAA